MTERAPAVGAAFAQTQARVGAALRSFDARAPGHAGVMAQAVALLDGEPQRNARRLALYRANAIAHATSALRAHYPVIERVVGEEFFVQLARAHCAAHASHSGDLGRYGAALADFLAACAQTQGLPYLPDLARLEWVVHEAEIAADVNGASALLYAPGTRVLASPYPIADLWLAHQDGAALAPETIDWRAQGALVHRDGYAVRVAALDVEQAHALIELLEGACA